MNKLEAEYLQQYLAYGLGLITNGNEVLLVGIVTETSSTQEKVIYKNTAGKFYETYFYEIKPILRPIEDLIKEISIKGEIFIPVEYFDSGDEANHEFGYTIPLKTVKHLRTIAKHGLFYDLNFIENCVVRKLIEWKFDVFGWINKGLAHDINYL